MHKLKILDILKYIVLKTALTGFLFAVTNTFNSEGNQQMIGFDIIVGIISVAVIYFLFSIFQKFPMIFFVIALIIINETVGASIFFDSNIISVILNGKSWQMIYKICDTLSVISIGIIFYISSSRPRRRP